MRFPGGSDGKDSASNAVDGVPSLGQEDPWRREWPPTPVFFPGEFHGQRSLEGYSPWGHKEPEMTGHSTTQDIFHCPVQFSYSVVSNSL